MKILFIHGDKREPGQGGGAESLLRDQAEGLKRAGHQAAWWYGIGSLEKAIEDFKPDVCHLLTTHCYPMGLLPALYLQENKIPHVWHIQDYWPFCPSRMMMIGDKPCGECKHQCGHRAPDDYLKICNQSYIVAGNANTAEIYKANGLRCDAVVELGIDVDKFHPGNKPDDMIYCSSSILAGSWKGIHILKQAVNGSPFYVKHITGMPRDEVAKIMSHASIYVFPSLYDETFGLALCEAMASGCACISSDNTGGKAQIDDGVTGLLVPRGDVSALRKAIARLQADNTLRNRLGLAARSHVEKHHSLEAMTARWLKVYEDVL